MSLKHPPFDLDTLDLTYLHNGKNTKQIQCAHLSIYLTALLTLSHGRRDLVELATLWAYSACKVNLSPAIQGKYLSVQTAQDFYNGLLDEILSRGASAMVPTTYGADSEFNVCSVLVKAAAAVPDEGAPDSMGSMLAKAGITKDQDEVFKFIGKLSGVSAYLVRLVLEACHSPTAYKERMTEAYQLVNEALPSTFTGLPTSLLKVVAALQFKTSLKDAWDAAVPVFCGSAVDLPPALKNTKPQARRDRRWKSGDLDEKHIELRDVLADREVSEACAVLCESFQGKPQHSILLGATAAALGYIRHNYAQFLPMTFMSPEAFKKFEEDGRTKSVWEIADNEGIENTWHHRHSDAPLNGRAITDKRLYGERGDWITHGVITHRGMTDQIGTLASMYGKIAITWRPHILAFSTVCVNDSTCAPFVFPADRRNLDRLLLPWVMAKMMNWDVAHKQLGAHIVYPFAGVQSYPNFVEFQAHANLTLKDVLDVMDLC